MCHTWMTLIVIQPIPSNKGRYASHMKNVAVLKPA